MFGHLQCEHDCVPDCFEAPSCLAGCMQTTNLPNIICMSHAARTAAPAAAAALSNLLTELDSFFFFVSVQTRKRIRVVGVEHQHTRKEEPTQLQRWFACDSSCQPPPPPPPDPPPHPCGSAWL